MTISTHTHKPCPPAMALAYAHGVVEAVGAPLNAGAAVVGYLGSATVHGAKRVAAAGATLAFQAGAAVEPVARKAVSQTVDAGRAVGQFAVDHPVATGAIVGTAAAVVAPVTVLGYAGFGQAGVTAGSAAATIQSASASLGYAIAQGGTFAALQSAGATAGATLTAGAGATVAACAAGAGAVAGATVEGARHVARAARRQ